MYSIPRQESENYFRGEVGTPYHLSVGAVVVNGEGKILTHFFKRNPIHDLDNIYILMRETLLPEETLEAALKRGLEEEFGIIAKQELFIGSLVNHFTGIEQRVEKTTLYFLCRYVDDIPGGRQVVDNESRSVLEWIPSATLLQKMRDQGKRTGRSDLDESEIVLRATKEI